MNHVTAESAAEAPNVVIGTFMVNSHPATVLFDTGATHSFISKSFCREAWYSSFLYEDSYGSYLTWGPDTYMFYMLQS